MEGERLQGAEERDADWAVGEAGGFGALLRARRPAAGITQDSVVGAARNDVRLARLPAELADFTGRAAEIEHVRDRLCGFGDQDQETAMPVVAVIGPGGVGKSVFAIRVAHRVARRFPDGQLYVNLRGAQPRPLEAGEALAGFLHALGVHGTAIPAGDLERAALYRSVLTERRILVVLDDARDAAQVAPLLPGDGDCSVLITSRSRVVAASYAETLELDAFDAPTAEKLLAGIVGPERVEAESTAAAELLESCARLPLAIRISGARLAMQPDWTVASMVERLADKAGRLYEPDAAQAAMRACFETAYAALGASDAAGESDPARAFRLLGLWDGQDIGLDAAAALLDVPESDAEDVLRHLVDAHLLESPARRRYRLHDLAKLFAVERASAQERADGRRQAIDRLLDWYLHSTIAAGRVIAPGGRLPDAEMPDECEPREFGAAEEAEAWCAAERANLVTATKTAAKEGRDDIAWQLPIAARCLFEPYHFWPEWAEMYRVVETVLARSTDDKARMWAHHGFAVGCRMQRRFDESLNHSWAARDAACLLGDRAGEAAAWTNVANTYAQQGRVGAAVEPLQRAGELYRADQDRAAVIDNVADLGCAYSALGMHSEAVEHLTWALSGSERVDDGAREMTYMSALADSYLALGRFADSLGFHRRAAQIASETGFAREEAISLAAVADTYRKMGRLTSAGDYFGRALQLTQELGDLSTEGRIRRDCADIDHRLGYTERAIAQCKASLDALAEVGDRHETALSLEMLGKLLQATGQLESANENRRAALAILEEADESRSTKARERLRAQLAAS